MVVDAYAWLANHAHADEGVVRVAMVAAMTAVFVAGLVVPRAYDDGGGGLSAPLVFVGAYLAARITHAVVYLIAAVEDDSMRRRVVWTVVLSLIPSGAVLMAGASVGTPLHLWKGSRPPSLANSMRCATAAAPACRAPRRLFGTKHEGTTERPANRSAASAPSNARASW